MTNLFVILLFFFSAGCGRWNHSDVLTLSGTLEMTEHNVGSRVAARLSKLFVEEGDTVKKGQLIAVLDRYDQAKRDYERAKEILREGGSTRQTVEQLSLALEDQRVVSPVDGVVLNKVREVGEVLAPGGVVAVIGDQADLWVRVYVPEGQVNQVHLNMPAEIRFDGLTRPFKGRVRTVSPKAEFTPRNVQTVEERVLQVFAVKVRLESPEPFLRPGVSADVVLDLRQ